MKKVNEWIKSHKRTCAVFMAAMCVMMMSVGVSASGEAGVSANLGTFIESIKGALSDFTTTNLATILVAALSLTVGLAIAWFAYRFIKAKVAGALKRGKI